MNEGDSNWTRRDLLRFAAAAGLAAGSGAAADSGMMTRRIPATGESLPVIGLGTWQVFDAEASPREIEQRRRIVELLISAGGSVIDTSPMYNRAEAMIGEVIAASDNRTRLFLATKVWTDGRQSGERQMQRSADLMNTDVIDLMQVHNRRDLDTHLATLREWQEAGRIRYNGVTDYRADALPAMMEIMQRERPDFVQINYSLGEREADEKLLPLAQDLGIAVMVNRPYMSGRLFRAVGDRPVPDWARAWAPTWGQFFLKYIVSHPAVTCVIPATGNPRHMADNLRAGSGELPDAPTRRRMAAFLDTA